MQQLQVSQQETLALVEELSAAHKAFNAPVRRQHPLLPPRYPAFLLLDLCTKAQLKSLQRCQMMSHAAAHGLEASACNVKQCPLLQHVYSRIKVCETSADSEHLLVVTGTAPSWEAVFPAGCSS